MDLPKVPELQGARLAETKQDLKALGLVVTDLGASRACTRGQAARDKQLDEGRRFIDLAQAMGVPYVRMFGDKLPPEEPKAEVMKRVVDGFQQMAAHAKAAGVTVLIESHGDFTRSRDLGAILKASAPTRSSAMGRPPHVRRRARRRPPTPGRAWAAACATRT